MRDGRIAVTLIGKDRTMANMTRASLGAENAGNAA
jgi:hypothetical protein